MHPHRIDTVLFSEEVIRQRVNQLVDEIASVVSPHNLVLVGILRGSFVFLADLVRALHRHALHPQIDFMTLQSYGSGTSSSGNVRIVKDVSVDLQDATVVLIDDILDSGRTLRFAVQHVRNKGAVNVYTCALLDKPSRRVVPMKADFTGFEVQDTFVVGYGLDYDSHYRELPFIGEVTLLDEKP